MRIRFDAFLLLFLYLYLAGIFYIFIGERSLRGEFNIQFYADSLVYEKQAKEYDSGVYYKLIDFDINFLGPYILLRIFRVFTTWSFIWSYSSGVNLPCFFSTLSEVPSLPKS